MPRGRPTTPIKLDCQGRDQLRSIARSRSQPHGMVQRARIVLACAEGESHVAIASRLGISKMTSPLHRRVGLASAATPGTRSGRAFLDIAAAADHIAAHQRSRPPVKTPWPSPPHPLPSTAGRPLVMPIRGRPSAWPNWQGASRYPCCSRPAHPTMTGGSTPSWPQPIFPLRR